MLMKGACRAPNRSSSGPRALGKVYRETLRVVCAQHSKIAEYPISSIESNFRDFNDAISTEDRLMKQKMPSNLDRRRVLGVGAFCGLLHIASGPLEAAAAVEGVQLPKSYVDTSYQLIDAVRDSIEADLSGLSEREIRRRADPAKEAVKKFINDWSDAAVVKNEVSCIEIRNAVQELGNFYRSNGQRARISDDVAQSILEHLLAAESSLPEKKEKSIFPF